ncbi:Asp-tRNA(Asn)/Glu-tRNA(Gln) amidotransferase subunit GatC [Mycoplasmopsis edwardii]|uniref:Aspartyl/glutamyl-tRNA amidotransferase subunit C n=1 Tax=Mycoplasmopsis edwardii TaxID=53558 RepID=A0ACD4PGZ7_9BACT|nr:Asp-tRNA(Asn)/Glu-tRNA(Gln) amidotransferase subunit GatC [Mycoplasmopsis edwardii]WBP83863.1 aspartyl/glutamyl-tRNA amidotransferase subunit C [Mycoplasmopsis edwardii]
MKVVDKQKLKDIVSSLMMTPTDQVLDNILENWNKLQQSLEYFNEVDLENLEPMTHIDERYKEDFLRDDEVNSYDMIDKAVILKNAPKKDQNFVILSKVVK